MNKKQLINRWKKRPYSWSQHSSWEWDKDQWFAGYVLQLKRDGSTQMKFGNTVGESIHSDNPMVNVPHHTHAEYEVRAKIAKGHVELLGYFDSYHPEKKLLEEYKTSSNPFKWNQKSVDEHGQLTYYAMLLFLRDRIRPEQLSIRLHYIPVGEGQDFSMSVIGEPKTYETKRTLKDVLEMMVEVQKRRQEMQKYAENKLKELSTGELAELLKHSYD